MSDSNPITGGSFLIRDGTPEEVFTPEDFTNEQRMVAKTARDFASNELLPVSEEIEAKNFELVRQLFAKAGDLGLLMTDVPEEYGGLALDKATTCLVAENITGQGSFSVMFGAHTGIGTLPIVYYGTPELKQKYLPGLAAGTLVGCYCLTEPTAGSDALSGRTKAVLAEDGKHYLLNGTKQYITNGGLADVFIVFAKIDGEQFTGFVLDRDTPGLSIGPEEHKMGIQGSSTTQVILQDARVPVGNVLGTVGEGHKIAFNVLNIGRFKLGAACLGATKQVLDGALSYAMERKQFGKPIAEFGLIREKLAEMYVRAYATEATVYRTVGMIDRLAGGEGGGLRAIEEYSVECAIVKILGSETLDFAVDESVQIHGGYGFCAEYSAERAYRDSRINRIFEGTNEVNRLLIPAMLLRKGMKGQLPLFQAAKALQDELMGIPSLDLEAQVDPLDGERKAVANLKKICLFVSGLAAQKYGQALAEQQEVLARLADLTLLAYVAESTLLRTQKMLASRGEDGSAAAIAATRITCEDAMGRAEGLAREALAAVEEGDTLTTLLAALRRLLRRTPPNTVALRESLTQNFVERARCPW